MSPSVPLSAVSEQADASTAPAHLRDRPGGSPGQPPAGIGRSGSDGAPSRRRTWTAVLAWAPAGALAVFLFAAVRAGLPAVDALTGLLAVVVTQIVPGAMLWRLVRPVRGWWFEDVLMGFAVGTCLAVATQAVAGSLQAPWIASVVGPAVAVLLVAVPATRARIALARTEPLPLTWGPAVAAVTSLTLLSAQTFYRNASLVWDEGFRQLYVDLPFHLALAGQLAHRGPGEVPFVLGEPLSYHWFSHAWMAQVSLAGNLPLDAVLLRFMPALLSVVVVCAVAIAAVRISGRAWAGPPAALLAVAAGELNVFGDARPVAFVSYLSPSLALSIPLAMATLALLVSRWRGATGAVSAAVLVALAMTAAGTKGSALPVIVAGAAFATSLGWILRRPERRVMLRDTFLLAAALVAMYAVVFEGSPQNVRLSVTEAIAAVGVSGELARSTGSDSTPFLLFLGVLLLLSVLARGAGMLGLVVPSPARRDPATWLVLGTGLAGVAVLLLLSYVSKSQLYFWRNAAPALAIGSAIGIVALADRLIWRRPLVLAVAALSGVIAVAAPPMVFGALGSAPVDIIWVTLGSFAIFGLVIGTVAAALSCSRACVPSDRLGVFLGSLGLALCAACISPVVLQQATAGLPPYDGDVGSTERFAISADQIDAARWIREHSEPDDVIMTNRHCSLATEQACDSRRFHLAAYSERRVLVEGWAYTASWARSPAVEPNQAFKPFFQPDRLELNDDFVAEPDAQAAERLSDMGVRWVFIDKTVPYSRDLERFATPRLETEWAVVLELQDVATG